MLIQRWNPNFFASRTEYSSAFIFLGINRATVDMSEGLPSTVARKLLTSEYNNNKIAPTLVIPG